MRRSLCKAYVVVLGVATAAAAQSTQPAVPTRASLAQTMKRVLSYQWAHVTRDTARAQTRPSNHFAVRPNQGWIRNVFFLGNLDAYAVTHDRAFLDPVLNIVEANHWKLGGKFRFVDNIAIGQTYLSLYELDKNPAHIAPLRERLDFIISGSPMVGHLDWWWCDALFMAPATFAQMSAVTHDPKYIDFMDRQFWDSATYLFDREERLFFRDKSFFKPREANGRKIFWGRGNGWVVAGIARILKYMPADYPSRPRYEELLRTLAARVTELQQPDGFWRASLLDPDAYPGGESSGTALIAYGINLGIAEHVLDGGRFLPVVRRAWTALQTVVAPDGRVQYTQQPGSRPMHVKPSDSYDYGPGSVAFLAASLYCSAPVAP